MRGAKHKTTNLRQDMSESFFIKNKEVFEHLFQCISVGGSIPLVRYRWNAKTNEFEVTLVGGLGR